MSNGWLLIWMALFAGFAVSDFSAHNYGSGTFELIMSIGIGLRILVRFVEADWEDEE
jgi:hypothetical protein